MFDLYKGSDLLKPLSDSSGLSLDQINFIFSQVIALVFGFIFRTVFSPSSISPRTRHVIESVVGFSLLVFCFGLQSLCLLVQSVISYLIMSHFRPGTSEKLVFVFSMVFLGGCHTYRLLYDYAGYTLDITGPMMINTQRVSSLAFSYSDGIRGNNYSGDRAIKSLPSLLEVLSYSFSFHSVICGPFLFFSDYIAFIEGRNMEGLISKPKPHVPMLKKLVSCIVCAGLYLSFISIYYPSGLLEPELMYNSPYWYITFYLIMAGFAVRCKYYFAWKLADAVNFSSGMGFNGYDEKGKERWDLVDSVDVLNVEFATSMKTIFSSWNKATALWLRHVVYDRTGNTPAVFMLSAYWHGFYPGYYISFSGGAFFIILSRMVRHKIQAYFQVNRYVSFLYDVFTFCLTKVLVSYLVLPFLLLELEKTLQFYKAMYFIPHIVAIFLFILLKFIIPSKKISRDTNKET